MAMHPIYISSLGIAKNFPRSLYLSVRKPNSPPPKKKYFSLPLSALHQKIVLMLCPFCLYFTVLMGQFLSELK
jgi:hypothetical protein